MPAGIINTMIGLGSLYTEKRPDWASEGVKMYEKFHVMFETDEGMAMLDIPAKNIREVMQILRLRFPEDVGADGYITDEDGKEYPLDW